MMLYVITFLGKSLRLFFPFWTQISYCNRESSVVQCKSIHDKVQRPVLLSSRRTPSCRSVSFLFLIMCYCQRTVGDYTQKPLSKFVLWDLLWPVVSIIHSIYVMSFFQQNLWSLPTLDHVGNFRPVAKVDVKCIWAGRGLGCFLHYWIG